MAWNDGLEGIALQIAETDSTPLRVMAGPGTGKSFVMKRRIHRLLEEGGDPKRILAVTFTRNAAAGLVKDLRAIGVDGCEDLRCGTLHAFCFGLLSQQAVFDFLDRVPRPLINFSTSGVLRNEAEPMLKDIAQSGAFGGMRNCTKRVRAFEADWARLQRDEPGWPVDPIDTQFHEALLEWLRFHRSLLIGELVPESLRYLRNNPTAAVLTAFDHIVVDEYQDLNKAEQTLIDLLALTSQLAIVGDQDQSIYSFRHANPEGIVDFAQSHESTHDEVLDACRRCPKRVVAMADSLIRRNHQAGDGPRLSPLRGNPEGDVHVVQWRSLAKEAKGLARFVEHLIDEKEYMPGDIFILSPRRLIGYTIRDEIRELAIPVHSFYHEEALEAEDAQRAMCLLSLAVNKYDRVALRWWLGYGSPSWRSGAYRRLRQLAEKTGAEPYNLLAEMADGQRPCAHMSQLVTSWEQLHGIIDDIDDLELDEVIDELLPDAEAGTAVLRETATIVVKDCETLADLLDRLRTSVTQPEMPQEGEFVRVMSLHKAKGLTAKACIVAGCTKGLIPFYTSDETPSEKRATLMEQRRLFYVAMTRCTEVLALSSVSRIPPKLAYKLGAMIRQNGSTVASAFLDEFGQKGPDAYRGAEWIESGFETR